MTKILLSAAVLFALSTAVNAETGDRTANSNDVICHVQYHEGQLISRQVCMTRAQWRFADMQGRKNIRDLQCRGDLPIAPRP